MRVVFAALLLAPFALAACDEPPQEPDPLEPPPVPEGVAGAVMRPGLYAVGDGTTVYGRTSLSADGTFIDLDKAGATVHRGRWRAEGNTICLDVEGEAEDQQEHCWRNDPPDEDGSFMSRRLDGEKAYRVTPLAASE
jgi:hypothetical protein